MSAGYDPLTSFNSKLVRLEDRPASESQRLQTGFNSKLVRLEETSSSRAMESGICFNSKLVRLEAGRSDRVRDKTEAVSIPNWFD